MKRFVCGSIIVMGLVLLCACGGRPPTAEAAVSTAAPAVQTTLAATPAPTMAPPVKVAVEEAEATPVSTAVPTRTPEPTDTPAPTPEPTPDCLHGAAHPDVFSAGETVRTETGYISDKVSIHIQRIENPAGFPRPMVCFVADIYIEDITSIRSAWAGDTLTASALAPMDVLDLMKRENALLMINGDYVCKWDFGVVVSNGKPVRQVMDHRYDPCVLLRDGTMLTLDGRIADAEAIMAMDPWQVWFFGPSLLDENGKAKTKFNSSLTSVNPRTALGYYAPGHYCFAVVEGRRDKYSKGMTLPQLSKFMESLGCAAAYNLDGGDSSVMAFDGRRVSKPRNVRSIPDAIYICEPGKEN